MNPREMAYQGRSVFAQHASLQLLGVQPYHDKLPVSPAEKQLKDLSLTIFGCFNTRDWSNPAFKYFAPDISVQFETVYNKTWTARGLTETFEQLKKLVELVPDYTSTIIDAGCEVNERTGKGSVWITHLLSGLPDGLQRESVNVMDWERRKGTWWCVRHRGLRGVPGSDFQRCGPADFNVRRAASDPGCSATDDVLEFYNEARNDDGQVVNDPVDLILSGSHRDPEQHQPAHSDDGDTRPGKKQRRPAAHSRHTAI